MYIQILLQGGIPVYHAVHMWADLYVWSLSCQTTQWHLPSSLWFHTCSGQTRFSLQLYNTWLTVSVATPDWMSKPIAWFTEIRNLGHCDFTNGKMRQLSNVSTTSNVNKFRCWFLNSPQFADWLGRTFFDPGNIPDFSSPYNLWMYPAVRLCVNPKIFIRMCPIFGSHWLVALLAAFSSLTQQLTCSVVMCVVVMIR